MLRRRSLLIGGLGAAAAVGTSVLPAAAAGPNDSHGLTVVDSGRFEGGRLHYWRFKTSQIAWNPGVNVWVPPNYDSDTTRYPVVLLLHGGLGDFRWWHQSGGLLEVAREARAIVVMPDGGHAGWYSNNVAGITGPRKWENFHLDQLLPWVDAHYRTRGDAAHRAVAGFSMGGFGALKYVAKRPELFSAVSAYSGPPSIRGEAGVLGHYIQATAAVDLGGVVGGIYGVPWNEKLVSADNPMENISDYRGKRVAFYAGTKADDIQEGRVHSGCQEFTAALTKAGIAHTYVTQPEGHGLAVKRNFAEDFPKVVAAIS